MQVSARTRDITPDGLASLCPPPPVLERDNILSTKEQELVVKAKKGKLTLEEARSCKDPRALWEIIANLLDRQAYLKSNRESSRHGQEEMQQEKKRNEANLYYYQV